MIARFYAPAIDGDFVDLPPEETHHLTHVLRLGTGAEIAVFDGHGREFHARVESVGRRSARVRILEPIVAAPESRIRLTLAQAALKGDRMDGVIRDVTMLGATAVQPLVTARTVVSGKAIESEKTRERWRRVAIASAKQCRRAVVPEVLPAISFEKLVLKSRVAPVKMLMLVEPSSSPHSAGVAALGERAAPDSASLVVGPEGGWEPREIEAASAAGWIPITLGAATLRADAAALVAIAALRAVWSDL